MTAGGSLRRPPPEINSRSLASATSLNTSVEYGIHAGMSEMRKITVEVPEDLLERVQAFTGGGVTETIRTALKRMDSIRAQQELLKLRGTFQFSIDLDELREDRTWSRPTRPR
jgi:hypothetical protein